MALPIISKFTFFVIFMLVNLVCIAQAKSNAKEKIVATKNGKVRGYRHTTMIKKVDYFGFKGIPYAKSPTDELRFKVSSFSISFSKISTDIQSTVLEMKLNSIHLRRRNQ